jgi:hypothetical protein
VNIAPPPVFPPVCRSTEVADLGCLAKGMRRQQSALLLSNVTLSSFRTAA